MATLASDWLRHFRLLLWNRWTEFNETWQEARSQRPLPSLCFSGRWEKQDGRPGLWLAETFSTSSLKPLNRIQRNLTGSKISTSSTKFLFVGPIGKTRWPQCLWLAETFSTSSLKLLNWIQRNLTGSKISTSSTKFVFFGLIGKTRWPPWPLIGWDIFDFFSETAERNSTKLDRKQDLNVLYQVCVFRTDKKKSWPPWPLIGWDIFDFFSETAERNSTKLYRKQDLNVLYQVCVSRADRKNKMAALASDWLRHFNLLLWNRWTKFNETWQEARSQRLLPWLCFSSRWINKNCRPGWSGVQKGGTLYSGARYVALWASCWLLLWNHWTEFNETLQEARSKRLLPSLCYWSRLQEQDGRSGFWLAETFSTSSLKSLNGIQRNLTGSKLLTSSTKFVFFGPIWITRWKHTYLFQLFQTSQAYRPWWALHCNPCLWPWPSTFLISRSNANLCLWP